MKKQVKQENKLNVSEQHKYDNLMTSYSIFFIYFAITLLGGVFLKIILENFLSNETEINTLINFTVLLLILVLFIAIPNTRSFLISDAKKYKKNMKKKLVTTILLAVVFTILTYYFQKIILLFVSETSNNQDIVVNQFIGRFAVFALFSSVFLAPIIEEIVFRKGIYLAFSNDKISFIVSILVFFGIHIISTSFSSVGAKNYILIGLTYLFPSILLNVIYRFFGHNIYMSILAHFLNNVLAFALVVVAGKFIVG